LEKAEKWLKVLNDKLGGDKEIEERYDEVSAA
jgi:hypothetical protein